MQHHTCQQKRVCIFTLSLPGTKMHHLAGGREMPKAYPTSEEKRSRHLARMTRTTEIQGAGTAFPFIANVAAAGACLEAARLDGKSFTVDDAPLPPFASCPHPDQCSCMYGAGLPAWLND